MFLHGPRQNGCQLDWRVWAPRSKDVQLVLFRGDRSQIVEMSRLQDGWYAASHPHCEEDLRYAYRLDGERLRPDPASRWQPEGLHFPSALYFPEKFAWTRTDWGGIPREDLVFYELHVGAFTTEGTFEAIIPRLPQLRELGVTALLLMPVHQFPGTRDWGYNGVHPFAVQNSYGGPQGLQLLVDACHQQGLAVVLDVVYNYLGPEGNYLSEFGPYEHPTPLGVALNFDCRKCCAVRSFVLENVRFWLRDFQIDGLRLDAADSIFDQSETHILQEIRQTAAEIGRAQDRITHVIAEWDLGDHRFVSPARSGETGLAVQWNDDLHHSVHALLTGERHGCYADFGEPDKLVRVLNCNVAHDDRWPAVDGDPEGDLGRMSDLDREAGHHDDDDDHSRRPADQLPGSHFVASIQNHGHIGDRVRGDRFGKLLTPEQQLLAAGVLILSPFLPLLFMGEEYGEQNPFPYFCSFHEQSLAHVIPHQRSCDCGIVDRRGLSVDPQAPETFDAACLRWDWPRGSWQAGLREWYRTLLGVRRELPHFCDSIPRAAHWYERPGEDSKCQEGHNGRATLRIANLCTCEHRDGVLELIRGNFEDDAEFPILAYFNFSNRPQSLAETYFARSDSMNWRTILSSEWPAFHGGRGGTACSMAHDERHELQPFEVLVLSSPAHQELWRQRNDASANRS